jgi:hypothetical protein
MPTATPFLAAKSRQDDADLLLRRKLSPGGAADLLHNLFLAYSSRPTSMHNPRPKLATEEP